MASATGIPETNPAVVDERQPTEDEPLLGRVGDVSQQEGKSINFNFFMGTAILAQAGIVILTAAVWSAIFSNNLILFSAHPLLNSAGFFIITQAILVLQPTHTPTQKARGTTIHAVLNGLALSSLIAGLLVIEKNKFSHNGDHFVSAHAIFGLITYVFLGVQATVGVTQYYFPAVYGGVDQAKAIWKYHRASGYAVLTLGFATMAAATQTDFNVGVLHIKLWVVLVGAALVVVGAGARIKKQKLGFR